MDLISRSELVKLLEDRKREHYENYESFRNYMGNRRLEHETEYEECKRILTIVVNQPTVEAVPVVHGEWIKTFRSMVTNLDTGELEPKYSCDCSICKWHTGNQGTRFNFCPICGADMRKKV